MDEDLPNDVPMDEAGQMRPKDKYQRFAAMEKRSSRPKKSVVPAIYTDASNPPLQQRVPPDGKVILDLKSSVR
jgi:hypothetical protein